MHWFWLLIAMGIEAVLFVLLSLIAWGWGFRKGAAAMRATWEGWFASHGWGDSFYVPPTIEELEEHWKRRSIEQIREQWKR